MSVFIIEGWSDDDQLRKVFPDIKTIVTNGTKINNRIRRSIEYFLNKGEKIYLLTDPDEAGWHLARMIWNEYPDFPRILIDPEKASFFSGRRVKFGVEYMSFDYIREVLENYVKQC